MIDNLINQVRLDNISLTKTGLEGQRVVNSAVCLIVLGTFSREIYS